MTADIVADVAYHFVELAFARPGGLPVLPGETC
ncbi:hypothetical protein CBA19C8_37805 [Paraburkholderia terrae]|nr:hypothetical protein CBA19C8_37805 [Paraburkholderia terrae]GJH31348.1 hypothetical protein CBA19CS91_01345 [Paraburkholderia hospita]